MTNLCEEWYVESNAFDEKRPVMSISWREVPQPVHDSKAFEPSILT